MAATVDSKRAVFQSIADRSYSQWPAYRAFPAYNRATFAGLREDVRTVADSWFRHDQHDDVDEFVCELPLAYFDFDAHDPAASWHSDTYPMEPLVRAFLVKELHGWDHETTLERYLEADPVLATELRFEMVPDQSTLWRLVDLLAQMDLFEECDRSPLVTANDVLTLAKKRTCVG